MDNSLYNQDKNSLSGIFPEEIWIKILQDNITNPADHHRICNASPYLRSIYSIVGPQFLFLPVAQVMYENSNKKTELKNLVKFRSICKMWKSGIDSILQNLPHFYLFTNEKVDNKFSIYRNIACSQSEYYPADVTSAKVVMTHFRQTHAGNSNQNPFVFRSIKLECPLVFGEQRTLYLGQGLTELLRNWGQHVWHIKLEIGSGHSDLHNLHKLLNFLPNLKTLWITCFDREGSRDHSARRRIGVWLELHPFPTIQTLEYFKEVDFPDIFVVDLVKNNPHIKMLETSMFPTEIIHEPSEEAQFPRRRNRRPQIIPIELPDLGCRNLAKLCLNPQAPCNKPWAVLFPYLVRNFGQTLKELRIWVGGTEYEVDHPLELPNLEVFHLRTQYFVRLDFILPMQNSLKELSVEVDKQRNWTPTIRLRAEERVIKFYECERELDRSNVWTLFPKLEVAKKFYAQGCPNRWHRCTRKEYVESLRQNRINVEQMEV